MICSALKMLFNLSCLVVTLLSADNIFNHFGPNLGLVKQKPRYVSKLFGTLMVFLKDVFEKLIFGMTIYMEK